MHKPFLIVLVAALLGGGCRKDGLVEQVCFAGDMECTPTGTRVCSPAGTSWLPGSCPDDQVCVPGTCDNPLDCPDVCKDIICTPGDRVCASDNVYIYECDDTGTELQSCGSCAADPIQGVCYQGRCISLCQVEQKSYLGCEYYGADLDNARLFAGYDSFGYEEWLDAANSQYAVVVSNPDAQLSALVSITRGQPTSSPPTDVCEPPVPDDSFVAAVVLPPKGLHIFELPARNIDGTVQAEKAYRIASNVPIIAYQFNPLENVEVFSNDASLLLPTTAIGNDYYVMTRGQTFDLLKGYLTVVGAHPQPTEVTVTVTAKTLAGDGIPAMQPGDTFTTTLKQFEVLNIETDFVGADLTGSRVVADRPVVVFGGSEAANAPSTSLCDKVTNTCMQDSSVSCACPPDNPDCSQDDLCSQFITCCADHLEMQMFPISAWGTEYVAVRSFPRNAEKDVWRLLAASPGTVVTLDPPVATVPTLGPGEWYEFESDGDFLIQSSEPILVGQFLAAQDAPVPGRHPNDAGTGDPAFILIAPTRQFRDNYAFIAPNKYAFDYVSIAAPEGTQVWLDGQLADDAGGARGGPVGTTGWRAIRVPISDGEHRLACPATCSVMVHGYDQYVSYGYPGGLNLLDQ